MTRILPLALAAFLVSACDSPNPDMDAGPEVDAGASDAGPQEELDAGEADGGPVTDAGGEDAGTDHDAGSADAGPTDAGPEPLSRANFCARFTRARCAAHETCCTAVGASYGSVDACVTAQAPRCDDVFESPLFDGGELSFDVDAAALVLADAERAAADCPASESAVVLIRRATFEVAIGSETSGSCASVGANEDTAAAFLCDRASGVQCYTRVSGGLVSTCEASVADGQSCESAPCEQGSFCNAARVCAPKGDGGASCRPGRNADCLHNRCESMICAEASLCVRR